MDRFHISPISPSAFMIIASVILFGGLAYFIEGKYSLIHNIMVYASGTLWALGYILISKLTGNNSFIMFSVITLSISLTLSFAFLIAKKTNVLVQILCMGIWYVWIWVFVFYYL